MLIGLGVLWVIGCGGIMFILRDRIKKIINSLPLDWQKKFTLVAILLALGEEAIALILNNSATVLGASYGTYLTATNNYLDLVLKHSVIVFIPMFITWAWLLKRYKFKPEETFLLFGISGVISESFISFTAVLGAGFWIFVYGLMVYLPAYSIPENRPVVKPRVRHYLLSILLPILTAIPVAIFISSIRA